MTAFPFHANVRASQAAPRNRQIAPGAKTKVFLAGVNKNASIRAPEQRPVRLGQVDPCYSCVVEFSGIVHVPGAIHTPGQRLLRHTAPGYEDRVKTSFGNHRSKTEACGVQTQSLSPVYCRVRIGLTSARLPVYS